MSAAILFIAGPIVALLFWSWGLGALVFGLGAIVLGIRQVLLGEHRSERFLGVALLLGVHRRRWLGRPAVGSITLREDKRVILRTSS